MKKLTTIVLCIFMLTCITLALVSCELDLSSLGGLQNPGNGETPGGETPGGETPGGETPGGDEPEPQETTVKVKFVYKTDKENVLLLQDVGVETGFTEEILSAIGAIRFHGYGFKSWHTGETVTSANVYDFETKPTEEITLYANRGNLTGENATWEYDYDNSRLVISGTGDMYDYQYNSDAPWDIYRTGIREIVISDGITSIGSYTFNGFTEITSVTLPEGITKIGEGAFRETGISDINFPSTLESIGTYAFYRCRYITNLQLNEGLQDIGDGAFYQCTRLETVFLTDKIMTFGTSAFQECYNLTSAFYNGTREQYNAINIQLNNFWVNELANTYFYEESKPSFENRGAYWHYNSEDEIEQWYYTIWYLADDGKTVPFVKDYVDAESGAIRAENVQFMQDIVYNGYKFCSWNLKGGSAYNMSVGMTVASDTKIVGVRTARRSGSTWMLCGDGVWGRVRYGTLYIECDSGSDGRMFDFATNKDTPWTGMTYSNIVFNDNRLTHIGQYAFTSNLAIRNVDVPANVSSISENAFSGCPNLYYIFYEGSYAQLKAAGFENLTEINVVSYAKAMGGETYGSYWQDITTSASANQSARTAWTYELVEGEGEAADRYVLTIGGREAATVNYVLSELDLRPWNSYIEDVTEFHIRSGITTVGQYTCYGMSALDVITLPDTVTRIGESAFTNTLYYNDADKWENGALYISHHLIKVDPTRFTGTVFHVKGDISTPNIGTISIAENAFEGCTGITAIVIPKTLQGIYSSGMTGLTALETVYYMGTSVQWGNLQNAPSGVTVCYYQGVRPMNNPEEYWCYVEGAPTQWSLIPAPGENSEE